MSQIGSALGADSNSSTFTSEGKNPCVLTVSGTFSSQTVTLQHRDKGSSDSWVTFNSDGTDQTFTAAQHVRYDWLPGDFEYRLNVSNGGSPAVDVFVDGNGIEVAS